MNATLEDGSGQADCFADNWAAWGLLEPGACVPEHADSAVDGGALAPPPALADAPTSRAAVLFRLARKYCHVVATRARYVRVASSWPRSEHKWAEFCSDTFTHKQWV
jgi:hypothetical protein